MSVIPVLNSLHNCSLPGLVVEGARECLSLPYDLHLVCREGRLVRTHINLLTVISSMLARVIQQLPSTTGSSLLTISLPDCSKEGVDKVLNLFRAEWREEVMLGRQELEVVRVLGMEGFFMVGEKRGMEGEEVIEEEEEALMERDLDSEQDTESELGREMEDVIKDLNTIEEREQYEKGREFDTSIENVIADEIDKLVGDDIYEEEMRKEDLDVAAEQEKICLKCDTTTTELLLHMAEVHLEEELEEEVLKAFPGGCGDCVKCGETFNNDYEKKEHTSLQHSWDTLADMAKEVTNCEDVVSKKKADNDEISDDYINNGETGGNYMSKDKASIILDQQEPNATKIAKDVVSKMIEIKAEQPKGANNTKYSCNKCDHIWRSKPGQSKSKVLYLVKSHIIHQHFTKELEKGLIKNFKGKKCTLCGSTLGNKHGLKKHLIATHKYFDVMVFKDFDFVLANATEPSVEHGLKRKFIQSDASELLQKSKVLKIDSSLGLGGEGRLKEDYDISHIQSRIEFSDSDSEDET